MDTFLKLFFQWSSFSQIHYYDRQDNGGVALINEEDMQLVIFT
jgi:hypothetical protein